MMSAGQTTARADLLAVSRDLFRQTGFVVAVLVLALAALGLNASVQLLELHFKKEAVPMRAKFGDAMPASIGDWVQAAKDDVIDADVLAALATKEFLFCSYVNASALGMAPEQLRETFKDKSFEEQKLELARIQQRHPTAVLTLGLTYYTGKADTVAHIPERCYVGDGFDPVNPATEGWLIADRLLSLRHITFENVTGRVSLPCNVAYFFQVNGRYESDSLKVRAELQNLFRRYGYYAKVELMCVTRDREASKGAMTEFLAAALPAIESALPEWSLYEAK